MKKYFPILITQKECTTDTITDNVLAETVTADKLVITVDTGVASPASPGAKLKGISPIFTNSDKYLCPMTFTFEVDNMESLDGEL